MASLQERNGSFRILFSHHGKLHTFTIGKVEPDEAENKVKQADYLLMRLKQRLITLPDGMDNFAMASSGKWPLANSPSIAPSNTSA